MPVRDTRRVGRFEVSRVGAVVAAVSLVAVVVALAVLLRPDSSPEPTPPQESGHQAGPSAGGAAHDVLVVAHRGASAYAPHDTVAAAREAVNRGVDAVEADIRQTRDGHLVALYHGTLAPTTDVEQVFPSRRSWRVERFTLPEVRRLDSGSWFGPEFAGERVPTLEEMVEALAGSNVELIVEAKTPGRYPGMLRRLLDQIGSAPDSFREVESFDLEFLRRVAQEKPPVRLGAAAGVAPERMAEVAPYLDALNAPMSKLDKRYVAHAHELDLEVKVWSLNTPASVRTALQLGVDGIYSHRPDMVRRVLPESP